MPSRRKVAQTSRFREQLARRREEHSPGASNALGVCSPRQPVNTNGRAEAQASSMRSNQRYSSRRQVEKESRFSAAGRVRAVASSYSRYHDFLHLWPGTEHRNDRAAAKAPTFESDGRLLPALRRERWHQSRVIAWDGSRVSRRGRPHLRRFQSARPTAWRPSGLEAGQFPQRSHSHHVVPVGRAQGYRTTKAGIRES